MDGNDIFAVYQAVSDAVTRARQGKGATLIECYTYRLSDHTTSDDASRYRTDAEVKQWAKKEPIKRLKTYLIKEKLWSEQKEQEMIKQIDEQIAQAVQDAENIVPPTPEDIFRYMYKDMTPQLKEELDYLKRFAP